MFLNPVHSAARDKAGDADTPDQERIAKGRGGTLDCNQQLQTSWQPLPPLGGALHLDHKKRYIPVLAVDVLATRHVEAGALKGFLQVALNRGRKFLLVATVPLLQSLKVGKSEDAVDHFNYFFAVGVPDEQLRRRHALARATPWIQRPNTFWHIGAVCLKRHPTQAVEVDLHSSCHDMLFFFF